MTKRAIAVLGGLAAAAGVGLIWWFTKPPASVTFGPLTQPIRGAPPAGSTSVDETIAISSPFPVLHGPGLEPPAIAMTRPENLAGQGLSNAEVDRIMAGYRAEMLARGLPVYYY